MAKTGDKLMELPAAVERLLRPGDSLALGCALEGFIPFAAAHEIIRQGVGPLTLIGPISDICFDMIIAAGLVERVVAAWVGNVSTGIGYNFRRAVEQGRPRPLEVIDHSNFSLALALEAGARGLPLAVGRSPLGSDLAKDNPHFAPLTCPHSGERLLAIKALNPAVTILHVQRADRQGNCQFWGASGVSALAAQAAARVLVTCEEVVDSGAIRADPDRTLVPGFLVDAVCEVPYGAHPAPVQGYYGHDDLFYLDYAAATRQEAGAQAWLQEWVRQVPHRGAYLEKLGIERLRDLQVRHPAPSPPKEYGW